MRRLLLISILAALVAAPSSSAGVTPHVAACSNNLLGDGHGGPWRTTQNGGTLHGNTLQVDCPTPSTHWDVIYRIQRKVLGSWVSVFSIRKMGNGSPNDQSYSLSPYACDSVVYRTHVDNLVNGGNANEPNDGTGVHLAC